MGKSTISMVIFNSYVKLPEGILNYVGISEESEMFFADIPSYDWFVIVLQGGAPHF